MPLLKVDSITNRIGNDAPELLQGATIPSGKIISGSGGINVVGTVTATSFVGNGANLTNLSNSQKQTAIKLILDPLPFRS